MPINLVCSSGHKLVVKDSLAGKKIKCPKCSSILLVPEASESELVPIELVEDRGLENSNNIGPDWLSEDLPVNIPTPIVPAQPSTPQRKLPVAASASPSKNSPKVLIIAVSAVGSVVALSLLAVIAMFVFSGGKETAQNKTGSSEAVSIPPAPATNATPIANTNPSEPTKPKEAESAPATSSQPAPPVPKPEAKPTPPKNLLSLSKIPFDERATCFKLPAATWASAYDEVTGRLAVTNDAKGILIYSMEDLLQGKTEPSHVFPTTGVPTAVCLKHIGDNRIFVYAGKGACSLLMVDADSMKPFEVLELDRTSFVGHLAGSANRDDPYVYFTVTEKPEDSERPDYRPYYQLGRANLVTRKQEEKSKKGYVDCSVSPDGNLIFTRGYDQRKTFWGTWQEIWPYERMDEAQKDRLVEFSEDGYSPLHVLGDLVTTGSSIYQQVFIRKRKTQAHTAETDFVPGAVFKSKPFLLGVGRRDIVIGSSNHFGRLAVIPMPAEWFGEKVPIEKTEKARDMRYRRGMLSSSWGPQTAFYSAYADDSRNMGIVLFDEHLVIAPLAKLELEPERFLRPKQALPGKVLAGEQFEFRLQSEDPDATFQYVPNSDWLADERVPILGTLSDQSRDYQPEREKMPVIGVSAYTNRLQLRSPIMWDKFEIELFDNELVQNRSLPFEIRVGGEAMMVVGFNQGRLKVQRTCQTSHGEKTRVEIIEKDPVKKSDEDEVVVIPLALRAPVQANQKFIFTNPERLAGMSLPIKLQIGDEKMLVTGVNSSQERLEVTRTREIGHNLNELAFAVKEVSSTDLPKIEGNLLRWRPSLTRVGNHNLRIRVTSGDSESEWIWPIEVMPAPQASIPFYVQGVDVDSGTTQAVIWGAEKAPDPNSKDVNTPSIICIYDTEKREVLRQSEVKYHVGSAVLQGSSIYASAFISSPLMLGPEVRKKDSNAKPQGGDFAPSTHILRLDAQSFKLMERVALKREVNNLQVIGEKYLVADNARFSLPDLKAVKTNADASPYYFPIHGRLKDGWVMDGIVWNEKMTKPRLLLHPINFERAGVLGPHDKMYSRWTELSGTITAKTNGPNVAVFEGSEGFDGYRLRNFPTVLSPIKYGIKARPSGGRSFVGGQESQRIYLHAVEPTESERDERIRYSTGMFSEDERQLYAALDGQLRCLPLTDFEQKVTFQFVPEQSSFVLETGKPIKLQYSAPGAAKYHLDLRWRLRDRDEKPFYSADSTDGSFELNLDSAKVADQARFLMATSGPRFANVAKWQEEVIAYLKNISAPYKELTGKTPKTIPVPVYVTVSAEHEKGFESAGLVHSYLVEPPLKELQKQMVTEGK